MNVTVPVGVTVPDEGATVAVNVTDAPDALGVPLEVSVVVVAWLTTWERTLEVLVVKFVSPT